MSQPLSVIFSYDEFLFLALIQQDNNENYFYKKLFSLLSIVECSL